MTCPGCGSDSTRVTDSRPTTIGTRRRRECEKCGHRFTTYERIKAKRPTPPAQKAAA